MRAMGDTPRAATPPPDDAHEHAFVPWHLRLYALIPILLVLYLSFLALRYLFVALLVPVQPPAQVTEIPTRLTQEAWRKPASAFVGQQVSEQPRVPLAHYHRIDGWFQPDPQNSCTTSGCHASMPHAEDKATRAFLNMHATSLHCGVCHIATEESPLPLVWYGLDSGAATDPPALLRLFARLRAADFDAMLERPTAEFQAELVALTNEAAAAADQQRQLSLLARRLAAGRHTSPAFRIALESLRQAVPQHFHGEYGAKLALRDETTGGPILGHAGGEAAAAEYLRRGSQLDAAAREALLTKVHPQRRTPVLQCTDCHVEANSLVDLTTVGYPQARIESLYRPWIFQAIERIAEGQPLYLPGFVVPDQGAQN